jgi:hypothetical protein
MKQVASRVLSRWFPAQLIFFTLMMEAICSSEMSVDYQWATRCYITEDDTVKK